MTVSRASRRLPRVFPPARLAVALLALALAGVILPPDQTWHGKALAQSQAPESGAAPTPLEAPTSLLPFDPSLRQPEGAGPAADAPVVSGIEINPLSELDPDSLGLLDAASGGLGTDLWADSDRDRIIALLSSLPDRYPSAVLRNLARRLLLSRGDRPGGSAASALAATMDATAGAADALDPSLLVLRVDRLGAVGDTEGLARFLDIVPRRHDEEPIARARVETALLSGDITGGCGEVRKGLPLYFSVPYWQKALIACQLVAGESDQAALGLGLLKERGLAEDKDFFALADALTGAETKLSPDLAARPLPFALLQARGQALPPGTAAKAELNVLVAMALSSRTGLEQRTAAAERAVVGGALDPAELARAYQAFVFDAAQLQGTVTPDVASLDGRALAYQRSGRAALPELRARTMAAALDAAWQADSGFAALAAALQFQASQLPRMRETLPSGGPIGRALYAAGRFEAANAWLSFVQKAAATRSDSAAAATALWPYWRLAGGVAAVPGGGIASWEAAQAKTEPDRLARRSALLRAALEALDLTRRPVPSAVNANAAGLDEVAAADRITQLARAAAAGRRGETVLLALASLGDGPLDAVEPALFGAVLTALSDVGFELEARALAIETALAARI